MATPTHQINDIVDEILILPEDHLPLCSAQLDDGSLQKGAIRFLLNREVLDLYRDIIDAIEISRGLPDDAHPGSIQVTDSVVLFLIQNDPEVQMAREEEKSRLAREKASGWYKKQKRQVESDAMFIAFSYYNELNIVPIPYRPGEIAFRVGETEGRVRKLPSWMAPQENYEIPLPERRLDNPYERRLKQLHQLVEACGVIWTAQFRGVYEKGLIKTLQLAEPRDEAGFSAKPAGRKIHAKHGAKNKDEVDPA